MNNESVTTTTPVDRLVSLRPDSAPVQRWEINAMDLLIVLQKHFGDHEFIDLVIELCREGVESGSLDGRHIQPVADATLSCIAWFDGTSVTRIDDAEEYKGRCILKPAYMKNRKAADAAPVQPIVMRILTGCQFPFRVMYRCWKSMTIKLKCWYFGMTPERLEMFERWLVMRGRPW